MRLRRDEKPETRAGEAATPEPERSLTRPVIDAVYEGLLGHKPDDTGAEYWLAADSPHHLIAALISTPEFWARHGIHHRDTETNAVDAMRLVIGGGQAPLSGANGYVRAANALRSFPWDVWPVTTGPENEGATNRDDGADVPAATQTQPEHARRSPARPAPDAARVIGPYAQQFVQESQRRHAKVTVGAGLPHVPGADLVDRDATCPDDQPSVLILTEHEYLHALADLAPQVFMDVDDAFVPIPIGPALWRAEEVAEPILVAARTLLQFGFIEASTWFRFDSAARSTLVHTIRPHAIPPEVTGVVHGTVPDRVKPHWVWLVASRTPIDDRI